VEGGGNGPGERWFRARVENEERAARLDAAPLEVEDLDRERHVPADRRPRRPIARPVMRLATGIFVVVGSVVPLNRE